MTLELVFSVAVSSGFIFSYLNIGLEILGSPPVGTKWAIRGSSSGELGEDGV